MGFCSRLTVAGIFRLASWTEEWRVPIDVHILCRRSAMLGDALDLTRGYEAARMDGEAFAKVVTYSAALQDTIQLCMSRCRSHRRSIAQGETSLRVSAKGRGGG